MKVTDLIIDKRTVGNKLLLVDVSPYYEYVDGKRTENVKGHKYVVAMPDRAFDKLAVKIEGKLQEEVAIEGECVEVVFDTLELFVYWMNGGYEVGARATAIHKAKTKN